MKPINEMSLQECLELLRQKRFPMVMPDGNVFHGMFDHEDRIAIADRIDELTRWIPVSEQMPTEKDSDNLSLTGCVYAWNRESGMPEIVNWTMVSKHARYISWKPITPPEDV